MSTKQENIENKRAKNIEVFKETMQMNNEHPALKKAIYNSIENTKIEVGKKGYTATRTYNEDTQQEMFEVSDMTTIEAAIKLDKDLRDVRKNYRIGILNFASAVRAGGGVDKGANAQEESICRSSTLYPVLTSDKAHEEYYSKNRLCATRQYEDICIYSPDIIIFKDDINDYKLLPENEWVKTDVITCPAPNLRKDKNGEFNENDIEQPVPQLSRDEIKKIFDERISLIIFTAAKYKITHLILGAFGCGAFRNDPDIVSDSFYDVLINRWMVSFFDKVMFAIPHVQYNDNYKIFKMKFADYEISSKHGKELQKLQEDFINKIREQEFTFF